MPDTLFPLHIPLVPFKVLPQCWSLEGVKLSKSMCGALQEEMPENPMISSTIPTHTGFYSQKLWGFIFLALEPWLGGLLWGWDPLLPRYPSNLYLPHEGVGSAHSASLTLCPSYLSG